ncbi:carboxypeptidase-like regulatory domain-containing protein [Adhaeribacter aerolatus]|nr:carboxypeptidase-like regulatory domain-containing protein [Adhaeribacter aerolatus]
MKTSKLSYFLLFLFPFIVLQPLSGAVAPYQDLSTTTLTGTVQDDKNKVLSYVSVGVVNEETGTVTNELGKFILQIKPENGQGIIRFSFIGHETVELKVADAISQFAKQKTLAIILKAKPSEIKEVNVDAKRWITSVKGGKVGPEATFHQAFMRTPGTLEEHLGREVALLINNRKKQAFLKKLNFCINTNRYDDVKFRLNIYSVNNGRPHENILKENIYLELTDKKTGWVEMDLEPYNIYLEDDFVVSLEWIDCDPKPKNVLYLTLSGGFGGHTVFQKKASQAKWEKFPGAIGMNVTLQHEK